MKKSEASNGTKLHALIAGFQLGISMEAILKQWTEQSDPDWDDLAMTLQRDLIEGVRNIRRETQRSDLLARARTCRKDAEAEGIQVVSDRAQMATATAVDGNLEAAMQHLIVAEGLLVSEREICREATRGGECRMPKGHQEKDGSPHMPAPPGART